MMKVAVGLLIVALSDSYGLLIFLGAMPFMVVAARPSMLVSSPVGYLVAMFFPVLVAIVSMVFISAIFDSRLFPLLAEGATQATLRTDAIVLLGMVPTVLVLIARTIRTPRFFMPLLAAFGTVLSAFVLNEFYHIESDPVIAMAPMLAVAAVAVRFWPPLPLREPIAVTLLALGWVLSSYSFRDSPAPETREWVAAISGIPAERPSLTQDVAAFLSDKQGIMVDVERNAELVTKLGGVGNLIVAGQPGYEIAMQGALPRTRYIAVRLTAEDFRESDRVLRRFPELSGNGLPTYHEVFRNPQWRVFERTGLGKD